MPTPLLDDWQRVGNYCFDALLAAYDAHLMTHGSFEPRVLTALTDLGYGRSWPRVGTPADSGAGTGAPPPAHPWEPDFDAPRSAVRIGPRAVDLGGIGKGLTLRWAGELLHSAGSETYLVDAGGDCLARGGGPDGAGWRIGVEDPALPGDRPTEPVAVVNVDSAAVATSSTRLRRWQAGGEEVHHIIDPRTARSSAAALRSVTVVDRDPAEAEVWSKTLFLHGDAAAAVAARESLAALWVGLDGAVGFSEAIRPQLLWWRW